MAQLTDEEQDNVRAVLRMLKVRDGGLAVVAAKGRMSVSGLAKAMWGMRAVSAYMAIRVSQAIGAPIDDVLAGRYPGTEACRHCGHLSDEIDEETPDVQ